MQKKWWHGKTAYQIYPKSFLDTNGDGVGDLPGIIKKLDYLKDLGIDILWLSPIYCSPLADQGYDISDYYNIDPRFGTMEDLELLIKEGKKRGISILMDLVANHCSDEHEWFKKACEDPDGPFGKYFYIEKVGENGEVPCNWRGYFGGSCWSPLPGHPDRVYMHLFHKKQPDLNWENPAVRHELYKMINWWLDRGLGGFRIDAIINIKKLLPFRSFPADRADGLCTVDRMLEQAQGIGEFLNELANETFRKHDAFTVGEVFNEKDDELPLFIGDNGYFSTMFDFAEHVLNRSTKGWYDRKPVTPDLYKSTCFRAHERVEGIGFLSNIIENHDEPRGVSYYIPKGECSLASKKLLGGLNFFLPGLPFIYQGQEIGMENMEFTSIDQVNDINTIDEYETALAAGLSEVAALKAVSYYSRDNSRTPFQWDGTKNGGFTTGTPWLIVNPKYKDINYASQKDDPSSVFNFYKKMISLRNSEAYSETIVYGKFKAYLEEQHNLMAYTREGDKKLLVLGNFQTAPQSVELPSSIKSVLLNNLEGADNAGIEPGLSGSIELKGYQFLLLEIA